MYELISKQKRNKAEALRIAQLWLKNAENRDEQIRILKSINLAGDDKLFDFSKPFYWAGFKCSGVP